MVVINSGLSVGFTLMQHYHCPGLTHAAPHPVLGAVQTPATTSLSQQTRIFREKTSGAKQGAEEANKFGRCHRADQEQSWKWDVDHQVLESHTSPEQERRWTSRC